MADVVVDKLPFKYVSTGAAQDRIVFKGNPSLKATVYPKVVGSGTVQIGVGNGITINSDYPSYNEAYGNIAPVAFGNFWGDLHIKASGAGVVVNMSFTE